jgi:uncharacterized membrane protein
MTTDQPNLVDLLRQLRDDTTTLVREEVSLAKTEMSEKVSTFSRNAALLAVGGFIGLVALMMLLLSLASLLTQAFLNAGFGEGMAGFLGLFIVGAIVAAVSGVLIAKGMKTLKGKTLAPEKTIETLKEDKAWAQRRFA